MKFTTPGCGASSAKPDSRSLLPLVVTLVASIFILLSLSPRETVGGGNQGEWNRTYGGPKRDYAGCVVESNDGGYVLAGSTESFGAGQTDAWLVKTDSMGNEEWSKTYGGTGRDGALCVVETVEGGYLLAGYTWPLGRSGSIDAWLVKTDSMGNEEWSKTYGGGNWDEAVCVVETVEGGYLLAGYTQSFGAGWMDAWLVKTDSEGNEEWSKTYGGTSYDKAAFVLETGDGGYLLAGVAWMTPRSQEDAWLVKTDSEGNEEWSKTYGGTGEDGAGYVIVTDDGGYLLAGHRRSLFADHAWLVKTDSEGNEEWSRTYTGGSRAVCVLMADDGGYLLAVSDWFGAGESDFLLVKTDSEGNEEWSKTYGGEDEDVVGCFLDTGDGYLLAGYTESFAEDNGDVWLVRVGGERPNDIAEPHVPSIVWLSAIVITAAIAYGYRRWTVKKQHRETMTSEQPSDTLSAFAKAPGREQPSDTLSAFPTTLLRRIATYLGYLAVFLAAILGILVLLICLISLMIWVGRYSTVLSIIVAGIIAIFILALYAWGYSIWHQ